MGIVNGRRLLDLCYAEDAHAEVDMNVVMTGDGEFIEVQGTAEGKPFDEKGLLDLLGAGRGGCRKLMGLQRAALRRAGGAG